MILKTTYPDALFKIESGSTTVTGFFSFKHFKNEKVCSACGLDKKKTGIFNKYYKDSYIKSAALIHYGKKYFKILKDSKLNINRSIKSQFNLLRINDNKLYPSFFYYKKNKYLLKIYKEKEK